MKKQRIAYLIDTISSDKAGTEKQLLGLIERLHEETLLMCLRGSEWLSSNRLPCEVTTLGYKGFLHPSFPLVLARYVRLLKEREIDLVQTFFEDATFVGCLGKAASPRGHALIISRRDLGLGDEPAYHRLYRMLRPYALRLADGVVANAHAIKAEVAGSMGVPPHKIAVIYNGIEVPPPPRQLPALFTEFTADLWIALAANLKQVKRIDLALRALAAQQQGVGKLALRLAVLGEGKLRPQLERLAAELGVAERVHFMGAVANVSDYLYGAQVGVLCSDREGLSNAIMEYMACALPVVATAVGGNGELVDDSNGICVPAGDHIALAAALSKLASAAALRERLGERSLQKVREAFTWGSITPQWEEYYRGFAQQEVVTC